MSRPRAKEGRERGQSCTSIRARKRGEYCIASLSQTRVGRVTPQALLTSAPLCSRQRRMMMAPSSSAAIPFHPLSPIHRLDRPPSSFPYTSPPSFPSGVLSSATQAHTNRPRVRSGVVMRVRGGKEDGAESGGRRETGGTTCSITFSSPHKLKGKTGALRSVT